MEWSNYNFKFDIDSEKTIIYNTLTYYMVTMDRDDISNIFMDDYEDEREQLKEYGILVDNLQEERQRMVDSIKDREDDNRSLSIWMFTTMDCNFGCSYCFEKEENSISKNRMSKDTVDRFMEKVDKLHRDNDFKKINITLTGGEPMMNREIMRYIHNRLCETVGGDKLNYTLITNGSIIDEESLDIIKHCSIDTVQITLDGPRDIHDGRRHYKNKKGTFDLIMTNIKRLVEFKREHDFLVLIRVNVDMGNHEHIMELLEYFKDKGIHEEVVFNLGDTIVKYHDKKSENFILKRMIEIYDEAVSRGFRVIISEAQPCSMKNKFYLMLSPEGDIYKCPALVGNEEFIMGSTDRELEFNDELLNHQPWRECLDCEIVGTCYGGCGYREYLNRGRFENRKNCRKTYLMEVIKRNITKEYHSENKGVS